MANKIKKVFLIPLIVVTILFLPKLLNFWIDYLWFNEVGYASLFIKTLTAKFIIGIVVFLLVFIITFLTLNFTFRFSPSYIVNQDNLIEVSIKKNNKKIIILIISGILGFLTGLLASTALWREILLFLNQYPFGIKDPVFNRDISFYFFNLSLYETLYSLAILFLFILIVLNFIFTFYLHGLGKDPLKILFKRFGYLIVAFFLLLIAGYQLKAANLLYSPEGVVFGAGYSQLKVTLPYYYIASFLCFVSAVTILIGMKKGKIKTAAIGPVLLLFVIISGGLVENVVQNFIVKPNELNKEMNYIKTNLNMTNKAFGLNKIKEVQFPAKANLTINDLQEASATINNIRINDYRPAKTIFNQLQSMRPYYRFFDVDVDRYRLNGEITQVFLAARELDQNNLPAQAQTWINKYLKYTHGYGAVVAPVNKITAQGQPELIIKDIPPKTTISELNIKRPEIYFGQLTNDYVIVNTLEKEFDYPIGDENAETLYEGSAGISLSGINRLLFTINKGSLKILFSGAITGDSKILLNRNITERVKKIAPFLTYDVDPYLVINDGKLYWIIDAYTISDKFPYSEPLNIESRFRGINYIRNSVKVVIDAYNGKTDFYQVDENDPLIRAYAKIFPGLFKSLEEMPEGLKEHLRYPVDLFDIQSQVYQDYHMKNPEVFYNREDAWNIAKELYQRNTQLVRPYYISMQLPESGKLEYLLMRPYTPVKKDNMIAWLAARNDKENYGQLILFKFPKQKLVYGPMQIESRISQNSEISKELSLWDQRGSSVIRGNLLVIPVKDSILYVEPLYIEAENQSSLPEVKRVIVAYKDSIVMEETLEEALYKIFGKKQFDLPNQDQTEDLDLNIKILASQAKEVFDKAKSAAQNGNWAEYGKALKQLEALIIRIEEATNTKQ